MSWLYDLYETYECNRRQIAENLESGNVLLPIAHSTQQAQLEVVINDGGEFLRAYRVDKAEATTIIPVTEDSATRSSGNTPHPLEDKLIYIAGDYEKYTGINNEDKYEKYITQLKAWSESKYSTQQVKAILSYLSKRQLIRDLTDAKALNAEEGLLNEEKLQGLFQKDAFVRFRVEGQSLESFKEESAVYKNKELFEAYTAYYISTQEGVDLCYASGKLMPCSSKHPSKIRNTGDKSKLISANDMQGFTYRGRFSTPEQVASVGYETSQKAHNALRWLIQKQGFSVGEMSIIAWEISGKRVISPTEDTEDALFGDEYEEVEFTNEYYAKKLEHAARGYRQDLSGEKQVVVMGVEAATVGRLSITFYRKMLGSEFMANILAWHSTCFWRHQYKKNGEGKYLWFIGAPSPRDIAIAAFGDKNDKLIKATVERILPCIIGGRAIPKDIVRAAVRRASSVGAVEDRFMQRKTISIACALVRKSEYDYKEEEWTMALDRNNRDRSYVFGRLLGAAQKLEEVALYYAGEKGRSTTSERFSQQFVKRPGKTWKIINDNLRPYIAKLKAQGRTWYIKELQEIYDLISEEDFKREQPLSELYLLGYNCQLNSYDSKDKIQNNNQEENE